MDLSDTARKLLRTFITLILFSVSCSSRRNFYPDYQEYLGAVQTFWTCLGLFFPATIGIMAGANISGDLQVCC